MYVGVHILEIITSVTQIRRTTLELVSAPSNSRLTSRCKSKQGGCKAVGKNLLDLKASLAKAKHAFIQY